MRWCPAARCMRRPHSRRREPPSGCSATLRPVQRRWRRPPPRRSCSCPWTSRPASLRLALRHRCRLLRHRCLRLRSLRCLLRARRSFWRNQHQLWQMYKTRCSRRLSFRCVCKASAVLKVSASMLTRARPFACTVCCCSSQLLRSAAQPGRGCRAQRSQVLWCGLCAHIAEHLAQANSGTHTCGAALRSLQSRLRMTRT
jgi:hypothetical protein